jgi:histone H3/H4
MELSVPSITRLARKAGIKSISNNCFPIFRNIIEKEVKKVIKVLLVINSQNKRKTLMINDLLLSLAFLNVNMTYSDFLGTKTMPKK